MFIKVTFSQVADALLAGRTVWNKSELYGACGREQVNPASWSKRKARRSLERFLLVFGGDRLYLRESQ